MQLLKPERILFSIYLTARGGCFNLVDGSPYRYQRLGLMETLGLQHIAFKFILVIAILIRKRGKHKYPGLDSFP